MATLSHIPPAQILHLLRHRLRSLTRGKFPFSCQPPLRKRFSKEWFSSSWSQDTRVQIRSLPEGEAIRRLEEFRAGRIEVLNRVELFEPDRFWDLVERSDLPPLARETLHYQEFLVDFGSLLDPEQGEKVLEVIESVLSAWRERFPPGHPVAWQPFTVAYRAQCGLRLHTLLLKTPLERSLSLAEVLRRDLFQHGLFLEANLEQHLGGNHLFKDLSALAMLAGLFRGPTADRWLALVRKELPRQIGIQVLPDGGHYERSPMYHILVMGDLLDAALALFTRDGSWVKSELLEPLGRMARFLVGVVHGDGEIPLFNDSVLGQAPCPSEMFQRLEGSGLLAENFAVEAAGDGVDHFPDTGYTRFRSGGLCLVFDHGRLGPDELMGHVHNDSLSFELSWGPDRFIVDRGVYEYTMGPRREECRAIKSHNTPSVDGLSQAETWASFRVGKRWHAEGGGLERLPVGEGVAARWSRPGMPVIERRVVRLDTGVFGITDRIGAGGPRRIEIPFHFGPGVRVEVGEAVNRVDRGDVFTARWSATKGRKTLHGTFASHQPFEVSLSESVCWPRFHAEEQIARLVVTLKADTPVAMGTSLSTREMRGEVRMAPDSKDWGRG